MKNKNLIIIIIVVIIIILAAVLFFMKGKNSAQNVSTNNPAGNQTTPASGVKDTLLGLLENASGVKCSVTDQTGSYTVIAKGSKAKIDGISFASPQNPSSADKKGTMINDGTWAYIWSGSQGMKFNLKETQQNAPQGANTEEKSTDWKGWAQQMQASGAQYNCTPTVATDADFTPPSNVTFQDLGALLKNMKSNLPSGTSVPAIPTTP